MTRKITGIREEKIIDHVSGVAIANREEKTFYVDHEPPYVKLYLDNVLFLSDLPKGLNGILMALLERMPYTGKSFAINGAVRREIANELNFTEGSVRNGISQLSKGGLLIHIDTGLYQFNPHFFGRGDWKEIERLRLEIVYDYRGRTFNAEVEHRENCRKEEIENKERFVLVDDVSA